MKAVAHRASSVVTSWPVLRQDAALYALAAVFSIGVIGLAVTADYREWAEVALASYLVAAVSCEVGHHLLVRVAVRRGGPPVDVTTSWFRRGVILGVLVVAVLVPLGMQVSLRASATTCVTNPRGARAQPEVAVIERAGDRVAAFHDPYLSHPTTVGVSPSNDCKSVDAHSYFPYLPGMVPFGLPDAAGLPGGLGDARVALTGFTLLVVPLALFLAPATRRRKWRALQFLVVLPTGALPMVTGGDDLPVLALLLLGLVLLRRRRPVLAGLVMGLAGTLKLTAWPLVVLALLVARDEEDRTATTRYGLSVLLVAVPVIGAGVALGPHAFWRNVVMFPLGLTHVRSPAASPLPGQILVQLLPALKRELTVALVALGAVAVVTMLVRHPPRTAYAAARFAGWSLAFATAIAPATRFGYLIYPANMIVWAYLLHDEPAPAGLPPDTVERPADALAGIGAAGEPPGGQLASPTW